MPVRVAPVLSGIGTVIAFAENFVAATAVPADAGRRLKIVVEELARNIVLHGKPPADSFIEIDLVRGPDGIGIHVRDRGVPFDPRTDLQTIDDGEFGCPSVEGGVGWPLILSWCRIDRLERIGDENHMTLSMPNAIG